MLTSTLIIISLLLSLNTNLLRCQEPDWSRPLIKPIVINTWNFTNANERAWRDLAAGRSSIDAIESGCSQCEIDQCDGTVGYGGSPSEDGSVSLDAMIMDGESYDVGAVAGLKRIKNAISVARLVLERTKHSLLVGEGATKFALSFKFKEEPLETNKSYEMHKTWLDNNCQPNFWKNVLPDPTKSCGPYHKDDAKLRISFQTESMLKRTMYNRWHDTIGMVALDSQNRLAAGTSTNGARNKIPGRVGDSPIPGAGAYAARGLNDGFGSGGGAAATGDGDSIMRFSLTYQAVENLRQKMSPLKAAQDVIRRQMERTSKPYPMIGIVVLSKEGYIGAACCGMARFPFVVSHQGGQVQTYSIDCLN